MWVNEKKQKLINEVIEVIKSELNKNDVTILNSFLTFIPDKYLKMIPDNHLNKNNTKNKTK